MKFPPSSSCPRVTLRRRAALGGGDAAGSLRQARSRRCLPRAGLRLRPAGAPGPRCSPGAAAGGGPRPYRCRTGAARRCRRGCCSWRSRPPSCRCAPGLPSAVPAAARCLLAHTAEERRRLGPRRPAACLTQLPWQPIHSAAAGAGAAAAPLRSAAEARGGDPRGGAGRGGVTARRRGGRRRRGCSPQRTRGCSRARRRLASAAPRRAAQPPPGGWQAEGRSRRRGGGAAPSERGRRDLAGREPLGGRGRREGRASAAAGPGAPLARAGRGGGGGGTGTGTHGGAAGPAGSRVLRLGAGPARPFALGGPAEPPRRRNPAPVWKRGERRSPVRRRGAVPPARRRDAARRGALIGARWSGGTARPCGGKCPPSGCGGEPAARPRSDRLRVEGRSFAASAGAGCRLESAGQPTASASVPPYRSDALLIAGLADAPRFFHWSNRLRVVAPYALHGFQWRFSWLQDRVVRIILTLSYNGGGRCVV